MAIGNAMSEQRIAGCDLQELRAKDGRLDKLKAEDERTDQRQHIQRWA